MKQVILIVVSALALAAAGLALASVPGAGADDPPAEGTYIDCLANYSPCLPVYANGVGGFQDYDCLNSGQDGPHYAGRVRVTFNGGDLFRLDIDGDTIGCPDQADQPVWVAPTPTPTATPSPTATPDYPPAGEFRTCFANYTPCIPVYHDGMGGLEDYDCLNSGDDGPHYAGRLRSLAPDLDIFDLDDDDNGWGCDDQADQPIWVAPTPDPTPDPTVEPTPDPTPDPVELGEFAGCPRNYAPCLPQWWNVEGNALVDYDCEGDEFGDGPLFAGQVNVRPGSDDLFDLDPDGDGIGCNGDEPQEEWVDPNPTPDPTVEPTPDPGPDCTPGYTPCVVEVPSENVVGAIQDYDCWGDGNGPQFTGEVEVFVVDDWDDFYGLDVDGNGIGCEGVEYDPDNPPSETPPDPTPVDEAIACLNNYEPCLPLFGTREAPEDYDCTGAGQDGPHYAGELTVVDNGTRDPFGLDPDGDGVGCEGQDPQPVLWPLTDDDPPVDDDPLPDLIDGDWLCNVVGLCDLWPDIDLGLDLDDLCDQLEQCNDDCSIEWVLDNTCEMDDDRLACDGLGNCRPPGHCTADCADPVVLFASGKPYVGAGPKFTG